MSEHPPYPGQPDPNQPGWGQQPPPPPPPGQGGWGQQPPPPPGWTPPPGGAYGGPPPGGPYGPPQFEAVDAIKYGWKAFTHFPGPLLGATALAVLIPVAIQIVGGVLGGGEVFSFSVGTGQEAEFDFNPLGLAFTLFGSIVSLVLSAAVIRLALDVADGYPVSLGGMFSRIDFVQVLVAAVVVGIVTTVGLFLCILPGLILLFMTFFTNYFIIGKGQDAITAIKSSMSLVSKNVGPFLLLGVLALGCMLAGMLACCVGLFVAYPVVTVATTYAFRVSQGEPVRPL